MSTIREHQVSFWGRWLWENYHISNEDLPSQKGTLQ